MGKKYNQFFINVGIIKSWLIYLWCFVQYSSQLSNFQLTHSENRFTDMPGMSVQATIFLQVPFLKIQLRLTSVSISMSWTRRNVQVEKDTVKLTMTMQNSYRQSKKSIIKINASPIDVLFLGVVNFFSSSSLNQMLG